MSRRKYTAPPEGCIQRAILDYLAARHILAFRMNTGAVNVENRVIRFGIRGMADILAFPLGRNGRQRTLWIEVKTEKGKQPPYQKSFEEQVVAAGHTYIIAR
jgi:hypothetical protein